MSVRADSGSGMNFNMSFDPLGFITGLGGLATAYNEQTETSRHNTKAEEIAQAQNTLAEQTLESARTLILTPCNITWCQVAQLLTRR